MEYIYRTQGVCSRTMRFMVEDGIITDLQVDGGCNGNLSGIARLVIGMPAQEVVARLEGVRCNEKSSSCPDQLARALKEIL